LNSIEIKHFFKKLLNPLNLKKGDVVLVTLIFWKIAMSIKGDKKKIISLFHNSLLDLIGNEGTIVSPCHSLNLCGTKIIFNPKKTNSYERGEYPEFLRSQKYSKRSFHPFASYVAIGDKADYITKNVSRFAYGPHSPEARMIELNAKRLGIGVDVHNLTTIHHVEQSVSVPYRYTKEFIHPVLINNQIKNEPFYLYVRYNDIGLVSDNSKKLFLKIKNRLKIYKSQNKRINAHCFSLTKYFNLSVAEFVKDPFIWSKKTPYFKPYRK